MTDHEIGVALQPVLRLPRDEQLHTAAYAQQSTHSNFATAGPAHEPQETPAWQPCCGSRSPNCSRRFRSLTCLVGMAYAVVLIIILSAVMPASIVITRQVVRDTACAARDVVVARLERRFGLAAKMAHSTAAAVALMLVNRSGPVLPNSEHMLTGMCLTLHHADPEAVVRSVNYVSLAAEAGTRAHGGPSGDRSTRQLMGAVS